MKIMSLLLNNCYRAKFSSKEVKEGKAKKDMFSINVHKIGQGILGYVFKVSHICVSKVKYIWIRVFSKLLFLVKT